MSKRPSEQNIDVKERVRIWVQVMYSTHKKIPRGYFGTTGLPSYVAHMRCVEGSKDDRTVHPFRQMLQSTVVKEGLRFVTYHERRR